MAICRRMPAHAALTDQSIVKAIETEQVITEEMVLAVMWGK